jgi:CRP-like cAMP-binding protein
VPLFAGCSRREIANIAGIAAEKEFAPGEELIREGDTGSQFYVVLDGDAEVRRGGQAINARGGGDFFGEIALVAHSPRTATVAAKTRVRALVIDGRDFRALLGRQPDLQLKVLEALAERV